MRWFRHDASFYWLTASNPSVLSDIVRLFSAAYVAPHENDLSPVPIQRIARTLPFLLSSAEKTRFDVDAYYALSRRSTPYQYGISPSEEFMLEERILKYLAERNVSLPLNVDDTE
ncbi:hypothetical protein H696_02123 [Fonticula alba]|uniref:Uncharacterized protein n=1 Tax=Fonticula alba TaxID=691883 RepID=A0A058ZB62_FONAL|nr:hypothetical protein H696_02123 [Fonticula alba]KCV71171.1 hypothetical protein H696_02123 [Fonticula alba]|eukprot:XP_009494294.1 hypothetical protein H696_02123 [Fonticula alba]